jgi:hypothetical protein
MAGTAGAGGGKPMAGTGEVTGGGGGGRSWSDLIASILRTRVVCQN